MNSHNVGNSAFCSSRFLSSHFLFCVQLRSAHFFILAGSYILATKITRILSLNSVLSTTARGSLDSVSAAYCFSLALCTILKSYFNNLSRHRASLSVVPARLRIGRNAW